jgi:hypothetical protein
LNTARLPQSLRSLAMTTVFCHCECEARSNLSVRVCSAEDGTEKRGPPPSPPQGADFRKTGIEQN